MGVSSTTNRVSYAGDGTSTVFPFSFYFFHQIDLKVWLYDTLAGGITTLVLNTDYTITGTPNLQGLYPNGGNVVISGAAPVSTTIVVIDRNPIQLQNYALVQNGQINSVALVQELDYLTLLVQSLQDQVSRCVQIPLGYGSSFNPVLPSILGLAAQNNAFLQINGTGTGVALSSSPTPPSMVHTFNITNGGSGPITSMIFSSASVTSVWIDYDITYLATSPTTTLKEQGNILLTFDPTNGWRALNGLVEFDNSNVSFSVNSSTGQVSYNSVTNAGTPTTFQMNWSVQNSI